MASIKKQKEEEERLTIGNIWRWNCLLNYVIEGKIEERIEVTGRREIKRKQLLDDLKENKR